MIDVKIHELPYCDDYYCNKHDGKKSVVARKDVLEFEQKYLDKFTVNHLSPNSKVYFLDNTEFPRYRLRDYGKDKNISITRDINNADIVIGDKLQFRKILDTLHGHSWTNKGLSGLQVYKTKYCSNFILKEELETKFSFVEELLNYNGKVIDVSDLIKEVCKDAIIFDCEQALNINRMLCSTKDDQTLALELIANSDLQENLVKNFIILASNFSKKQLRYNKYTTSVNFMTVMAFYDNLGLQFDTYSNDVGNLLGTLKQLDLKYTPSDIELIDHFVQKELKAQFGSDIIDSIEVNYKLPMRDYVQDKPVLNFSGIVKS